MKSVWLACEGFDEGHSGWSILGVFSSREQAAVHIAAFPIVVRRYADGDRWSEYDPLWVVEVSDSTTFVHPNESLKDVILAADKRKHLWVEEWHVDERLP